MYLPFVTQYKYKLLVVYIKIKQHWIANSDEKLLKKIRAIETTAIKIAYSLPPWTTNGWCYSFVEFKDILSRIKVNAKTFLNRNSEDELIKPLIDNAKPSHTGQHSAVYKALNW